MTRLEAMRLLRTVKQLHPLQVATRIPHLAIARSIAIMPGVFSPRIVREFSGSAPKALVHLANAEVARGRKRLAHLDAGSRLRAYEATYGLEIGDGADVDPSPWKSRVALEPYPASVRARRMAIATRLGSSAFEREIARACRSVILQLELHLLGNHLLENAFALTAGGLVTEGAESDAWLRVGSTLLEWQLPEQFLADGGHFERTASYHVALTYALCEAIELVRARGREVPALWLDIAKRALSWMENVRAPDGTYPLFNDAALDAAPTLDDVLALGAEMKLFVPRATPTSNGVTSIHLPQTGWALLRCGELTVAFDAGADGAPYQPGHVHADALTIEAWVGTERLVVDYGVASYAVDEARDVSRSTRSHNTVEIEGHDSSEVWAAFRVGRRAHARLYDLREGSGARGPWISAEAAHDGYAFLPGAPQHTRRIEVSGRELRVHDQVSRSFGRRNRNGKVPPWDPLESTCRHASLSIL